MFAFLTVLGWMIVTARKHHGYIQYQVSGVGRFDTFLDNIFGVPQDKDAVVVDVPQLNEVVPNRFPDGTIFIHPANFRTVIHMAIQFTLTAGA